MLRNQTNGRTAESSFQQSTCSLSLVGQVQVLASYWVLLALSGPLFGPILALGCSGFVTGLVSYYCVLFIARLPDCNCSTGPSSRPMGCSLADMQS
jgi:hypothetical protein